MSSRKRISKSEDAQFKVIMVGMSGSGKSCLLTRYTKDVFLSEHSVTVGTSLAMQESSLLPKSSRSTTSSTSNCRSGIQLDRRVSSPSSRATIATVQSSSLSTASSSKTCFIQKGISPQPRFLALGSQGVRPRQCDVCGHRHPPRRGRETVPLMSLRR